ncbi:MAG: dihydropteroate synthase, partial [Proteobacteria bacterium]|nr:dihydropteroate synthase [Pseudomonadota bacterium]
MSKTKLVGIVNVTPDSFSDGGRHLAAADALAAIEAQAKAGADVVDIGAESTRPGAHALSWAEEWERLEPVFAGLGKGRRVKLSLDSYHAQTVEHALPHIDWINDVTGFSDGMMMRLAAESG